MALIQKAFSDIITFSRSSNATRTGPTGLVEYAPHNLLLRSQEFDNASWTKNSSTVTANSAAAPDGTVTADKLMSTVGAAGEITQAVSKSATAITYTVSVYAKAAEFSFVQVAVYDLASDGSRFYFNLSSGTVGVTSSIGAGFSATSRIIQSVGNGWYRCICTFTTTSTTSIGAYIYPTNADGSVTLGNGTSGIYLWGAQLSVGPYPLDYTPTTTAAVYGPRFDYDGSGVTIVDPVSTNLLTYSEQFDNAAWSKTAATVTANSTTSPDGTVNADTLTETATTNFHSTYQTNVTLSAIAYTFSCFAKPNGRNEITLVMLSGTDTAYATFNVSNGSVSIAATASGAFSGASAAITASANGFYKVSLTAKAPSTSVATIAIELYNAARSYAGNGTSGVYLWGAQLEVGSTATAYMVSGATNGFRAVPVVSGSATPKGLLVEEQRTNLATYSEDLTNAAWNKFNTTISSNAITSPDGTVTADKIIENATTSGHYAANTRTAVNGTVYTTSVYLKMAERRYAVLDMTDGLTGGVYVYVDLQTGVITQSVVAGGSWTNASATITNSGNGWYRVSVTGTLGANNTATPLISTSNSPTGGEVPSYTGDGTSGIYAWGAQLEAGSFATSYVPTVASSVTRSADVASVNTLSPWFNATEGTLFAEFDLFINDSSTNNQTVCSLNDGTTSNEILIYRSGGGTDGRFAVVTSGATQADIDTGPAVTQNIVYKLAGAYKLNDFAASISGLAAVTDASGTIPTVSAMQIGAGRFATAFNGHIRRIAYYPVRLSNAQLPALTA